VLPHYDHWENRFNTVSQVINLMLEKVQKPIDDCLDVLNRIYLLLDMVPPSSQMPQGPEKAQHLFNILGKAESVSAGVSRLEQVARRRLGTNHSHCSSTHPLGNSKIGEKEPSG